MDPLSISLVPGYLLGDDEPLTPAIARAMARPTIALAGTIGAATINDGAITTAKLADGLLTADAVGRAKMEDGYIIESKVEDDAITPVKLSEAARGDVHQYADGVFTAGVYAITLSPAATAYTEGMVIRFKADTLNTGATNLNVNGLGEKNLFKNVTQELAAGDIPADAIVTAIYDGTNYQMLAVAGVVNATRYASAETALSAGQLIAPVAHNLGAAPRRLWVMLKCTDAGGDLGYSQNDLVPGEMFQLRSSDDDEPNFVPGGNATEVWLLCQGIGAGTVSTSRKDTGATAFITAANWKAILYAEL